MNLEKSFPGITALPVVVRLRVIAAIREMPQWVLTYRQISRNSLNRTLTLRTLQGPQYRLSHIPESQPSRNEESVKTS